MAAETSSEKKCEHCSEVLPTGVKETCPHCGNPIKSEIPNYPRFGGGVFMVFWIFFIALIIMWVISLVTF